MGEKTARALVEAYPSIDAMLEDAGRDHPRSRPIKGSPSLRAKLREAREYLAAMRAVVPIRVDLDARTWRGTRDDERLEALGQEYRLSGPIGRLQRTLDRADRE